MKLMRLLKQTMAQRKSITETVANGKVICDNCK